MTCIPRFSYSRLAATLLVLTLALCAMDTLRTHAAQNDPAIAKPKQKTFASPDDLATAYVTACEQQDTAADRDR